MADNLEDVFDNHIFRARFQGTVEGNDHPRPALAYFDSVKHYPRAASWGNGGAALKASPPGLEKQPRPALSRSRKGKKDPALRACLGKGPQALQILPRTRLFFEAGIVDFCLVFCA